MICHCHGFYFYFVEGEKAHFVYVQRTAEEEERFSQACTETSPEGSQEISAFGRSPDVALWVETILLVAIHIKLELLNCMLNRS